MYKMIVIDDEYLVRKGITETIKWSDYDVEIIATALNGEDGLNKILELKPDIILSDIKMPKLDGVGLVKELHDINYDGIIIILSGYNDFEYAKSTLENGVYKYLLKPISNDELILVINEAKNKLDTKRKMNMYITDFSVGIPFIKQNLINSIYYGQYDQVDLLDKMALYEIPVITNGVIIYCSADLSSAGNSAEADENVINALNIIKNLVIETLKDYKYFYSITEKRIAFATSYTDIDNLERLLIEMLRDYEKRCKVLMSIGISGVFDSLDKITSCFGLAKFIATNKLYVALNSVTVDRSGQTNKMYKKNIVDTLEYISNHYNESDLKIKTVADYLYVSESYLMHLFKKELGKTFNSSLTEYRIMMAKRFLREQKYKVYEIAEMVGYSDIKYFSQVFRKLEGCTTSEYVRLYNEKKS